MKNKNLKIVVSFQFFSALCCLGAVVLLGTNYLIYAFFKNESISRTIIRIVAGLLFICSVLLSGKIAKKDILLVFFALYLLLIQGTVTQNIAYIILATVAFRHQASNLWKYVSNYQFFLAIVVIICLSLGIVENTKTTYFHRVRYSLGFINVNSAAIFFFSVVIIWVMKLKRVTWRHYLIALAGSYCVYRITDSRTAFASIIVFILCCVFFERWHGKRVEWIVYGIEVFFFLSPFFTALFYHSFSRYDFLLSYRLSYYYAYFYQNSLQSLLLGGSRIKEVDSYYLLFLYNSGLLFYTYTGIRVIYSSKAFFTQKRMRELSFVLSILAFGVMESAPIRCEIICMMLFWNLILNTNNVSRQLTGQKTNSDYLNNKNMGLQ